MDAHAGTGTLRAAVVQAGAIPFDTEACVDKAVRLVGEAAAAHRSYVVIGVIERDGATCHCTPLFFGPDGALLGKHRKLMPTVMERVIERRTLLRAHRRRPRHLAAFDVTHRARGTLFRSHCMPVPAQAGFSADGTCIAG